jgi:cobalt-zinc-cadmium efflux system membrane fusion protein
MKHLSQLAMMAISLFLFVASAATGDEHGHQKEEEPDVELTEPVLAASGITLQRAAATPIRIMLTLPGRLVPNEDRVAHITPRYPGLVKEVRKRLGDTVSKGEILANIESNQTLQTYSLPALVTGIVTARHATLGEFVDEQSELFVIADYSELYADFAVFADASSQIKVGQKILIRFNDLTALETSVSLISPVIDIDTQSRFARAIVVNPDLRWQPGGFVSGDLVLSESTTAVAVRNDAIQMIEGRPTVFVRKEGRLLPRTVMTGRSDADFVEILSGVSSGEEYASGNTFLLKAQLSKSEAKHDH